MKAQRAGLSVLAFVLRAGCTTASSEWFRGGEIG